MKELALKISVFPIADMSPYNTTPWITQEGFTFYPFELNIRPEPENSPSGLIYNTSLSTVVDQPSREKIAKFQIRRQCIVVLYDILGEKYILGSIDNPAYVYLTTHLNRSIINISAKTLSSPFF